MLTEKPVNSQSFCQIFPEIDKQGKDYIVLGDNASWHLSQYTQKEMKKRNITFIRNVAYAPDLNPIEKVFLQLKTKYR